MQGRASIVSDAFFLAAIFYDSAYNHNVGMEFYGDSLRTCSYCDVGSRETKAGGKPALVSLLLDNNMIKDLFELLYFHFLHDFPCFKWLVSGKLVDAFLKDFPDVFVLIYGPCVY